MDKPGFSSSQALRAADRFKTMFPIESFGRWQFAGSLRRGEKVGTEVVHVVIPILDTAAVVDPERRAVGEHEPDNPVWLRLDQLVAVGDLQWVYDDRRGFLCRWHWRTVVYEGMPHSIVCAGTKNWGLALLAATGPTTFVSEIWEQLAASGCNVRPGLSLVGRRATQRLWTASEEDVFRYAGVPFVAPGERGLLAGRAADHDLSRAKGGK